MGFSFTVFFFFEHYHTLSLYFLSLFIFSRESMNGVIFELDSVEITA